MFYTEVFVGRETELARAAEFAAQLVPGCILVSASPGFGKSALVAELVRRHEAGAWTQGKPNLIYYFIREEGGRHTPSAFCSAVNSQLLDLLGERSGIPSDLESQRSQLLWLWARAVAAADRECPLLLLVDGLDEMARGELGEVTIADLLPGELGPHVHLLVTSRPNPDPLKQVAPEHPLRRADVMQLRPLGRADIEALLGAQGCAPEHATVLAQRVLEVTKGEPLLVRFVSEDVAAGGEQVLAGLEQNPPAGVKDYFRQQFEQLAAHAEADIAWEVLGLLLVVYRSNTRLSG